MSPRTPDSGVTLNEATNNYSSSFPTINHNSLTMSNSTNHLPSTHPSGLPINGLHQTHSFMTGANPYHSMPPTSPYAQSPHWQGNAYRPPQMMPTAGNPYVNAAGFSPYHQNRLPNPSGLPSNYNQAYMSSAYPPSIQNSQFNNSQQYNSPLNSMNTMPPPNSYPKPMSSSQMYPPRPSSQQIMTPPNHSYPSTHLPGAPHQYNPQNYGPKSMYPPFNGFLPYPTQQIPYPPGYPPSTTAPSTIDYSQIDNHRLSTTASQQIMNNLAQKQSAQIEFNGHQELPNSFNNSNNNNSTITPAGLEQNAMQQNEINNSVPLNSSLNKNSQQSPISNAIIDEASQASTNSSHNDGRETPKLNKQSHPTTPNPLGSPSNISMNSLQGEEFDNSSNPSWPRTPASPVVNTEHSKKKGESLQKLYEMSDEPERRIFLDKLINFNEKNGIKLNTCPHISKTLIDLFKLYNLVKERGGFVEVTKKKLWKECASIIKMPIASTTSYSLRKSYIKHLLPYECKVDRNGIDPEKLLASLESNSKKKVKNASPQPVDTNSQGSYPQATTPQLNLNTSNNQPSSKTQSPNLQSPNQFQNNVPTPNIPSSIPPSPQLAGLPNQMPPYHLQSQMHQQMKINDENFQRKINSNLTNYDAFNQQMNQRNLNGGKGMPNISHPFPNQPRPLVPGQNYPTDNYQISFRGPSQLAERLLKSEFPQPNYQQPAINQNYIPNQQQMKPPVSMISNSSSFSKRHSDFNKIEPPFPNNYPPQVAQNYSPLMNQHLNSQYPSQMNNATSTVQPKENYQNSLNSSEYLSNYYNKQPIPQSIQQHPNKHPSFPLPSSSGSTPFYNSSQIQTTSPTVSSAVNQPLLPVNQLREIQFASNTIEAVQPVFEKRKRLTSNDLSQIDPWKLMMSLKSGLLAETTWALDVLSILLHDDSTYLYFSLQNLPGLLELLLEHFKLYLSEIFLDLFKDIVIENDEDGSVDEKTFEEMFVQKVLEANEKFKRKYNSEVEDKILVNGLDKDENSDGDESMSKESKFKRIKLTKLDSLSIHTEHKQILLNKCENYTLKNRKGLPVYFVDDDENLFITDMSKRWDKLNKNQLKSDADHWKRTFFSSTDFIQRTIQPPDDKLQFAKNLNSSKTSQINDHDSMINGDCHGNCTNNSNNENSSSSHNQTELDEEDSNSSYRTYPRFREKIKTKKFLENHENEAYNRDSPPLCSLTDYRESIAQKCICFSTLIRNLSFIPGNDVILAKNKALLLILGRLLLLHHEHLEKKSPSKISLDDSLFNENNILDQNDDDNQLMITELKDTDPQEEYDQKQCNDEWWWEALYFIRENSLVTISNISGTLNLSKFSEEISLPIFSGLLHWMICPSAIALDNFKTSSITTISPSRLSLECLVKLSVLEDNVDLALSTPPYNRDITIYETLVNHLRRNEDQTLREFALVLLYNFATSDPNIARTIALKTDAIQQLIVFIELSEHNALNIINTQGKKALKENPESIGTTLDMVKRAALCLRCLARVPENRNLFFTYQQRLIHLVMTSVFDNKIISVIADVMYEFSIENYHNSNHQNNSSTSLTNDKLSNALNGDKDESTKDCSNKDELNDESNVNEKSNQSELTKTAIEAN